MYRRILVFLLFFGIGSCSYGQDLKTMLGAYFELAALEIKVQQKSRAVTPDDLNELKRIAESLDPASFEGLLYSLEDVSGSFVRHLLDLGIKEIKAWILKKTDGQIESIRTLNQIREKAAKSVLSLEDVGKFKKALESTGNKKFYSAIRGLEGISGNFVNDYVFDRAGEAINEMAGGLNSNAINIYILARGAENGQIKYPDFSSFIAILRASGNPRLLNLCKEGDHVSGNFAPLFLFHAAVEAFPIVAKVSSGPFCPNAVEKLVSRPGL